KIPRGARRLTNSVLQRWIRNLISAFFGFLAVKSNSLPSTPDQCVRAPEAPAGGCVSNPDRFFRGTRLALCPATGPEASGSVGRGAKKNRAAIVDAGSLRRSLPRARIRQSRTHLVRQ